MILMLRFIFYLFLLLLIFLKGVENYSKLSTPFKVVTILIGCTLLSEMLSRIAIEIGGKSFPVYHFFIPIQFILLSSVYSYLLDNRVVKKNYRYGVVIFICLCLINGFFYQSLSKFPSNTLLLSSLIMIFLSLLLFRQIFYYEDNERLSNSSQFWFNCAVLVFFTITFLFWSLYNSLLRNKISTKPFATFIYFVNIFFYLLLGWAIVLKIKAYKPVKDEKF